MATYFTSDQHFFHRNIIRLCSRPFLNLADMHRAMIENWNETVDESDRIYILGDFVFGGPAKIKEINDQLKGQKILVRGNHDHKVVARVENPQELGFVEVVSSATFDMFNLSHYPYRGSGDHTYQERFSERRIEDDGKWLLCGHVHTAWQMKGRMINVGCDLWNFRPVALETLKKLAGSPGS